MSYRRIMIVEDEAIVAMCLERTVRKMGHEVACVVDKAEDAVVRCFDVNADLVLMDIRLKGEMDGIEAARIIREKSDTPVVFLSAYNDSATMERADCVAPLGFLAKPVDEILLSELLAERA